MLLIRKAHPPLWDQPSSWFLRGRRATQGVGPNSTNQRQDAIDRHVAPVGPRVVVGRVSGELLEGEGEGWQLSSWWGADAFYTLRYTYW